MVETVWLKIPVFRKNMLFFKKKQGHFQTLPTFKIDYIIIYIYYLYQFFCFSSYSSFLHRMPQASVARTRENSFFFNLVTNSRVFLLCNFIGSSCRVLYCMISLASVQLDITCNNEVLHLSNFPGCNLNATNSLPATSLFVSANRL